MGMKNNAFARRVFLIAGIYGLIVLLPQYFMERTLGQRFPPAINHPEQFYGLIGVAIAWQCAFLLIACDVERYRLFMLPAVLEKLSFGIAALILYAQGRAVLMVACAGGIDLVLGACFVLAFKQTRDQRKHFLLTTLNLLQAGVNLWDESSLGFGETYFRARHHNQYESKSPI